MDGSGDDTSVESGETLIGVESSHDSHGVTEHSTGSTVVLDDNSGHFEGVGKQNATESIGNGNG